MNEWDEIKSIFRNRIKTSMTQFLVTMLATVVFDLTAAIVLGICVSMFLFVINNSSLHVETSAIEPHRLDNEIIYNHSSTSVIYFAGPLFFGNKGPHFFKSKTLSVDLVIFFLLERCVFFIVDLLFMNYWF